jgi:hypothetical protein
MTRRPVRAPAPGVLVKRSMIPSVPSSTQSTPLSSAYPSTYGSEVDTEDEVSKLSIASLSLDVPLRPFRPARKVPLTPFHFLMLPSELRIRIYDYFFDDIDDVLDLGPDNYKRAHKKLGLMRVCRQIHEEATHFFYSTHTFRLFPTHPGRYFKTKKPLLARMKPNQRECMTSIELRLGPGWNAPPRGWVVNDALGLKDCINVHKLKVFVECDPSDGVFKGFRRSEGFYETFSRNLVANVLDAMPAVDFIEFDAWSSVKKSGAMMHGLLDVAAQSKRIICWGPERGWTDNMDEDDTVDASVRFAEGVSIPGYVPSSMVVVT